MMESGELLKTCNGEEGVFWRHEIEGGGYWRDVMKEYLGRCDDGTREMSWANSDNRDVQ